MFISLPEKGQGFFEGVGDHPLFILFWSFSVWYWLLGGVLFNTLIQ